MITKEKFVKYIEELREAVDMEREIKDVFSKRGVYDSTELPNGSCVAVDILDDIFSPVQRDICYFCFDLDFGRYCATEGYVVDGVCLDLSSAEKLYDWLVSDRAKELNL